MLVSFPSDEAVEAWFAVNSAYLAASPPETFDEVAPWVPVVGVPGNDNRRLMPVMMAPIR